MLSSTVIEWLNILFTSYGMPNYIYSNAKNFKLIFVNIFHFERGIASAYLHGTTLAARLLQSVPVKQRKFFQRHKNDNLVEKDQLLEAIPTHAIIWFLDGRESDFSCGDSAPRPVDNSTNQEFSDMESITNNSTRQNNLKPRLQIIHQ